MPHAMSNITIISGKVSTIQSRKPMLTPASFSAPRAMPLGGVPIGVAMPPILLPIGMARARAMRPRSFSGNARNTGARNVSIIAAVAVLLTNMEKMAVTSIKPKSTIFGLVPKGLSMTRARVTSTPLLDATRARMKPPMKSITVGSAKAAMMSL